MSATSTGARLVFKLGPNVVAFANAVSYTVTHTHQPVDILGQPEPAEYAETGYTVNFSATMFRVNAKGAIAQGLRPTLANLMRQKELTCTISDEITGLQTTLERVKCTQEDFNVDARSNAQVVLSFVAIKQSESDAASNSGVATGAALTPTNGIARVI